MPDIYRILLIEDNPGDARLLKELLVQSGTAAFTLEWADRLSTGLERLRRGGIDAVLLDLSLPDSRGFETFQRAKAQFPRLPFIILTGTDDEELAVSAVREGAQDYMVKGQVSGPSLARAMRYAIERQRQTARVETTDLSRSKGRIVGFTGAKGGVGTTTLALNIASILAQRSRVIAVELRGNHGSFATQTLVTPALNFSSLLGADPGSLSASDLRSRVYKRPSGLHVMYGPQCPEEFRPVSPDHAQALLSGLADMAELVVADIPSDGTEGAQAALRLCNFVVLVVETEPVALGAAKVALNALAAWGVSRSATAVLFNSRVSFMNAYRFGDLRAQVGCGVVGLVPPAPDAFLLASVNGVPLALSKPDSTAGSMLAEVGRRLASDPVELVR